MASGCQLMFTRGAWSPGIPLMLLVKYGKVQIWSMMLAGRPCHFAYNVAVVVCGEPSMFEVCGHGLLANSHELSICLEL